MSRRTFGKVVFLASLGGNAWVATSEAYDHRQDIVSLYDDSLHDITVLYDSLLHQTKGSPHRPDLHLPPNTEQVFITTIEDRFRIKLLSIQEAYRALNISFNPNDHKEFGPNLPKGWDIPHTALLAELLPDLPEPFYGPDKNGNELIMSLTSFGTDCTCGGVTYWDNPEMILFNVKDFSPDNKSEALRELGHEGAHHVQSNRSDKSFKPLLDIIGQPFVTFAQETDTRISLLTNETDDEVYVSDELTYGIKDTIGQGAEKNKIWTDPVEFEAVLSEFYLHGKTFFVHQLSRIYDHDFTLRLYHYMEENVFGGREYPKFPVTN